MQGDDTLHDPEVGDALGVEGVQPEATQPQGTSVVILKITGDLTPPFLNLILSRWKNSLRNGNDYFKLASPIPFHRAYDYYVRDLLNRPNCRVRLAVLSDDQDVVLGFSVTRGSTLDYVHVLSDFRRQGIGKLLVPPGIDTITHLTRTGLTIWGSKYPKWSFNPYA